MRCLIPLLSFLFTMLASAQTKENIDLVKLELYGSDVSCNNSNSNGKIEPYYYSPTMGPDGGVVAIDTQTTKNNFGLLYPIVARIRIFKKGGIFPDNLSVRIDLGYSKNGRKIFPYNLSYYGVSNEKILGKDKSDANKFYLERSGQVKNDQLYLYTDSQEHIYRLDFLFNSDIDILRKILVIKD